MQKCIYHGCHDDKKWLFLLDTIRYDIQILLIEGWKMCWILLYTTDLFISGWTCWLGRPEQLGWTRRQLYAAGQRDQPTQHQGSSGEHPPTIELHLGLHKSCTVYMWKHSLMALNLLFCRLKWMLPLWILMMYLLFSPKLKCSSGVER